MIRFLLLDIDDTLLDFAEQEKDALGKTFSHLGLPLTPEMLQRHRQITVELWQRHDRGACTRDDVIYGRFRMLFDEFNLQADPVTVEHTYQAFLCRGAFPIAGAKEALARLARQYAIYGVTNGLVETAVPRLEKAGMMPFFRAVFVSDTIGAHKPEAEFFHRCFARIPDFDPACAMIIGDNLQTDIRGGLHVGLKTCWFNYRHRPADPTVHPDHTVTKWSQVESILL